MTSFLLGVFWLVMAFVVDRTDAGYYPYLILSQVWFAAGYARARRAAA